MTRSCAPWRAPRRGCDRRRRGRAASGFWSCTWKPASSTAVATSACKRRGHEHVDDVGVDREELVEHGASRARPGRPSASDRPRRSRSQSPTTSRSSSVRRRSAARARRSGRGRRLRADGRSVIGRGVVMSRSFWSIGLHSSGLTHPAAMSTRPSERDAEADHLMSRHVLAQHDPGPHHGERGRERGDRCHHDRESFADRDEQERGRGHVERAGAERELRAWPVGHRIRTACRDHGDRRRRRARWRRRAR